MRVTGKGLIDHASKEIIVASVSLRASSLQLSSWMVQAFEALIDTDTLGNNSYKLQTQSADYRLIKHLFHCSLVEHHLTYHIEEWCDCLSCVSPKSHN